jgi:hypothetical protein
MAVLSFHSVSTTILNLGHEVPLKDRDEESMMYPWGFGPRVVVFKFQPLY